MPARAIVFDLDGTLADTAPIWRAGEDALFAACGMSWDAEVMSHCIGMNARDLAATVHRLVQPAITVADCQQIMRDGLIGAYRAATIVPVPGAAELVRRLAGHVPMMVASGSPLPGIERCVEQLGIAACFDRLLTSETVARGKPHPDVFLRAAELLELPPADCVVFEDSLVGTQAAVAAGMPVIVRPQLRAEEIAAIATRVVATWDDVAWPVP